MSKSIYSYIRKEYEHYKYYSDSTIKKLLPNWCNILKLVQNGVKKEYEEKLRWIPIDEKLPTDKCLIILDFSGCCGQKKYVIYNFDPEYFEGKFHVNGVVKRWRKLIL